MHQDDIKLVTELIASRSKHRELAFSFLKLERDFRNELRDHMDTKLELSRLKKENQFLLTAIDEFQNPE